MQAPVDYPLNDAAHTAKFSVDELTYAVMLDRGESSNRPVELEATHGADATRGAFNDYQPALAESIQRKPQGFRSVPRPLAAIAQTLIAGHSGQLRSASSGMLSRLARTAR